MAQFDVHGFDGILTTLERFGRFDDVAPKMMEAGSAAKRSRRRGVKA